MNLGSALRLKVASFGAESLEKEESSRPSMPHDITLAAGIIPVYYPKGGSFFLEGQPPSGVFLLRSGRAKEFMISSQGKTTIVRVAGPGSLLGLPSVLAGIYHDSTVETLEPAHAGFIRKATFLQLLKTSHQLNQMVASQLIRNCREAYESIRCLDASRSVAERFARLLLQWADSPLRNQSPGSAGPRIRVILTHEEIGQFVGSTRETMCRVVGEFRKKRWITTKGSTWTIANVDALRRLAEG
ncbi:MAG TPA: Crp/Fnr family transcriptional regulator [Alphaproteobacteria bacterium]|nr:Crp/Fnr family transcriptional regulator [Alphaproteobacteria bacterium]